MYENIYEKNLPNCKTNITMEIKSHTLSWSCIEHLKTFWNIDVVHRTDFLSFLGSWSGPAESKPFILPWFCAQRHQDGHSTGDGDKPN